MNPQSHQVVHVRDFESYSENAKFVLNILSISEVPRVVGSARYLEHKYPGDIDALEEIAITGSRDQALDFYTNQLQSIAQELSISSSYIYLIDFKAGLDDRFNYEITKDTTSNEMMEIVSKLYCNDLISDKESENMLNATTDWEDFKEIIRKLKTVRWSLSEVTKGYKILRLGKILEFRDAISMDTVVKIDVISWLQERFMGVEMFFVLKYRETSTSPIIPFFKQESYYNILRGEVDKYSNPKTYNPLKLVKRLWNLSTLIDCSKTLENIIPLLQSDAAALNQIKSDSETLIELMNKYENIPIGKVFLEIIHFRKRIGNHVSIEKYEQYRNLMDCVYHSYIKWKDFGYFNRDWLIDKLEELKKWLNPMIVEQSDAFVRQLQKEPLFCEPIVFFKDQPLPPSATQYVNGIVTY